MDLAALFAAPTPTEIASVSADWETRDVSVRDFREELETPVILGGGIPATLRVVSHTVDGARHYGAIVVPTGAQPGSLPVLVYAHGGDGGVNVEELLLVSAALGDLAARFVYVVPSFRSETLRFLGMSWLSSGEASPWDRDVDDALALLNVALMNEPAADASRRLVLGTSRGGGVGLLMAVRDSQIDGVVEFFGPTDFYGVHVQEIVEAALEGGTRDLPGFEVLNGRYLQPLRRGEITIAEMRRQMLLRSPVYFAERMRAVQIHHGSQDEVVDVSHAETLIDRLQALDREPPAFEFFLYPAGRHDILSLSGSPQRTIAYLSRF